MLANLDESNRDNCNFGKVEDTLVTKREDVNDALSNRRCVHIMAIMVILLMCSIENVIIHQIEELREIVRMPTLYNVTFMKLVQR